MTNSSLRPPTASPRTCALPIHAAQARPGQRALALQATGRWEGAHPGGCRRPSLRRTPEWADRRALSSRMDCLSEETKDSPSAGSAPPGPGSSIRSMAPRNSVSGLPDWGVHVALTENGRCLLGAVALPAQDRVLVGCPAAWDSSPLAWRGRGVGYAGINAAPCTETALCASPSAVATRHAVGRAARHRSWEPSCLRRWQRRPQGGTAGDG